MEAPNKKPTSDAMREWMKVETREQAYRWHLRYTPWFTPVESAKIVNLYDEKKFKTDIGSVDSLGDDFDKLLLSEKILKSRNQLV